MKPRWLLFLSIVLFLASCSKDKDEIMPVITISSPYADQVFNALDTMIIKATVEDDNKLELIEITVCNENKVPVLATVSIVPQDKSVTVNIPYALNDINLASGDYYLWIKAFDGTNTASKYRGIKISEVPRELDYIYIMSVFNSTTVHLQRKVPGGNIEDLFDINGDIIATASSSKFQMVATCGSIFGNMNVYDISSGEELWSLPVISNPPFPYFTYLQQSDHIFYCSYYDGTIKGYNNAGSQVVSAVSPTGTFPEKSFANSQYLFADHGYFSGSERTFGVYYKSSGMLKQQIITDYFITDIFQADDDHVFLFANQNGQGIIRQYSVSDNGTWEPHTLPAGKIFDVAQIDDNNYIIAHENGLYLYQYNPNSLTSFSSGSIGTQLKYDAVNDEVYSAYDNTISIFDCSTHQLLSSITVTDSIAGFELIYNK